MKSKKNYKNIHFHIMLMLFFCTYTIYCLFYGGSFVRGVGWRTKEEYPMSYNIMIVCGFVMPIGILVNHLIPYYNKRNQKEDNLTYTD